MAVIVSDYPSLQSAAQDYYLGRIDLAPSLPAFITNVEAKFNRKLRNRQSETTATASCTASSPYVALPTDYLEMRSLTITNTAGEQIMLRYKDPVSLGTLYVGDYLDLPVFFTITGTAVKLAPTPDNAYTLSIDYFAKFQSLVTNTTNFLVQNHPDLYLYGVLAEMALYLQDTANFELYEGVFQSIIGDLLEEEQKEFSDGTPLVPTTDYRVW